MRKAALLTLLTLAVAFPLHAVNRSQSYFTYDDGGTIVRQGEDRQEIEARVNLPLFPGDEVVTSRRGRAEIRLSDGNVIGLDRSTNVVFRSILDSYEGDASQTVVDLRSGHVAVQRTPYGAEYVRIDTESASYVATREAVYSVESDRGQDRLSVFDGAVEVRTPQRTSRVRAGEEAGIDGEGVYRLVNQATTASDDFERWFLRRADRNGRGSSRYLDSSLAYAEYDLAQNGAWVYSSNLNNWCWRPRVAVGWRPYYNGHWMPGLSGALVWVSYEPWGWVPYHYGRWGLDPMHGWVWMPGSGYSPAWVYWMYGSGYVGWAPAGWWDIYRPYYDWCYRPYTRASWDNGWGSYGRVRPGEIDLRPWTFVRPNGLVATRVATATLTVDAVRQRVLRPGAGSDSLAAVSTSPARFTRSDLRDPASAVNNIVRRGVGGTGGSGAAAAPDLTSFIRRDTDLSSSVRERVIRTRPTEPSGSPVAASGGSAGTVTRGGLAPIGGGAVAPIGGGALAPATGGERVWRGGDTQSGSTGRGTAGADRGGVDRSGSVDRGSVDRGGVVRRGETQPSPAPSTERGTRREGDAGTITWRDRTGTVRRGGETTEPRAREGASAAPAPAAPTWRDRVERGNTTPAPVAPAAPPADRSNWRNRAGGSTESGAARAPESQGGSDVPRRVIDRIGGARLYPSDGGSSSGSRDSAPPRVERSSPPRDSGSSRDSAPPRVERSAPAQRSSPPPAKSEGSGRTESGGGRARRGN